LVKFTHYVGIAVVILDVGYAQGGYNLNSISESADACLSVLLGDRVPLLSTASPPNHRFSQCISSSSESSFSL